MAADKVPFWQHKSLAQMDQAEWESLCDGCGKCCLVKLQDEEDDAVYYTNVACRYLDEACRCQVYGERLQKKPDCIRLQPGDVAVFSWLPASCAYRRLAEGKPLPAWHPLLSGSDHAMHRGGHSVAGRVYCEDDIHPDDLECFVVQWVE
ncbi:MAG TPA: YcgN family cysteine cluster protein [Pseudomonadales bacterium]